MPSIIIKTADELATQRHAGELLASVFTMLDGFIQPGVTTMAINNRVEDFIVNELHSRPASKGQYDFPYVLNTSVNEVVCHGIPKESEHLKTGSIVNVDITLEKGGLIADSSKMYLIGDVSPLARRLVKKTYEAMWKGIKAVKPGATLGDIGHAIQSHVEGNGYSVVREYCGHGVGKEMHEDPQVLHYGKPGEGAVLKEGMVFTIEPMVNQGDSRIKTKKDGWTVVTRDKKLSAQWEHTIAVTADGFDVLTLRPDETIPD
ncbi:type I methionyl aminopeptidase [Enterobacter sp. RHBSTW-00175]|uniref:type I methionyl aminopeptidase n=1 Tax=Enterobacter sp. RHBSTW-00175 TaxID=2742639 RepID=UPI0015E98BCA|nr:type I methionyl aminopeptidase [Enterobacter sp. RHBSTW-00175]HDR2753336.1 type I methionyl aminopeptidase [Enterobacter asburiae]QMR74327.1 type I methionyl aminopeptidase [Enterobacter sp. RHBSTW-00175]HDR2786522.1 type I methionyl aminopeptidase [Enterobacter asburiae]HDR2792300.1 type I methionyl aminopeptidase [Enterobacter asburiae]HDR2797664.1 type I methionyl aminopeptidase [Enterobacter asburiae]